MQFIDLTGKKFNRLTVISRAENRGNRAMWDCLCECGTKTLNSSSDLTLNNSKSCGCFGRDVSRERLTTHNMTNSTEYNSFRAMKERCYNKNHAMSHLYHKRGITVCQRWLNSFENFFADMGKKPSKAHTIERINNDGNYCPENCKWGTPTEQANNKRNNHKLTYMGETLTIAQWSRKTGIKYRTILSRIRYGFSIDKVLT